MNVKEKIYFVHVSGSICVRGEVMRITLWPSLWSTQGYTTPQGARTALVAHIDDICRLASELARCGCLTGEYEHTQLAELDGSFAKMSAAQQMHFLPLLESLKYAIVSDHAAECEYLTEDVEIRIASVDICEEER
jgi:phosphoribosylaminoimidazole carboxylase (NCAIR synthetase)